MFDSNVFALSFLDFTSTANFPDNWWGRYRKLQSFSCSDGDCIPFELVCDGVDDCGDNSDEQNELCLDESLLCGSDRFQCNNGNCLPLTMRGCGYDTECPPYIEELCSGEADTVGSNSYSQLFDLFK